MIHVDARTFSFENPRKPRHFSWARVANASTQPIYDVSVELVNVGSGEKYVKRAALILPGETGHLHLPPMPDRELDESPISVTFRDNSGRTWRRQTNGELFEVEDDGTLWHHHGDGRHRAENMQHHGPTPH